MCYGTTGCSDSSAERGRFVVLKHDWPEPHHDLIAELQDMAGADRLPTWALYPERSDDCFFLLDRPIAGRAIPLQPHRRQYLDYEGPVSQGRGSVMRECHGVVIDSASDETGDHIRIDLGKIRPGEKFGSGELIIERRPNHRMVRDIPVGLNHVKAGTEGYIFEWRPKSAGGMPEDGSVA